MLLQSLIVIASMVVLAGAVLTSTLVSAKAMLHQSMLTKTQAAMNDATADFVNATATIVASNGTERPWPDTAPIVESLCGAAAPSCPLVATIRWKITGTSANVTPAKATSNADATYLEQQVDEQRISATLSVIVSGPKGVPVYDERSRELTARVFTSNPYVVVTGSKDLGATVGDVQAAEGDTAGAKSAGALNNAVSHPESNDPSVYTDTRIFVTVDCVNTNANLGHAKYDPIARPFGNLAWKYEGDCDPTTPDTVGAPASYEPQTGSVFVSEPASPTQNWQKNDEDSQIFPR